METWKIKAATLAVVGITSSISVSALAAEAFQLRYNLAGSLGGEMFAPPDQAGWAGGVALTYLDVNKVTGDDGKLLRQQVPGGVVPLPAPTPAALYPSYAAQSVEIIGTGSMPQWNLGVGYLTQDTYGGGRLGFALNVPYATKRQYFDAHSTAPVLKWNPAVPAATRAAVAARFNSQYQATLDGMADAETGEVSGIGDIELQAGWLYVHEKVRVLAGASVVLPTGKYDAASGPDIGYGNFYTFRPAIQVAYLPTPDLAIAGKLTLGLNTKNHDNDLRSGNWVGLEAAVGYKTPVGVIGIHGVRVQQYQDDRNNPWGSSRLRSTNAGLFFTTKIPSTDIAVTLQYMATTDSRNAKHGDFTQVRMLKLF
ncbi:transporter [Massilia sp. BJB1822]|uniref:transporter n=1 Tax=Massilia sp. BJB1822 TaxID=2744470 RepID=UPI0015940648|nr:transporter [Massilia sp. BJB1822]NVE01266.1 transporter [Massilia sp. BJB1822]